jgi:Kef-type K+ transport system membrane component KefB
MARKYRAIRRAILFVSLSALLVITASHGVITGLALIGAFVVGLAVASLDYLEDEARKKEGIEIGS